MSSSKIGGKTRVIGLTGGIGTGKSTAAEYFIQKGFYHIDADEISRELTADGSPILSMLGDTFGPNGRYGDGHTEILDGEGRLRRKALASVVFNCGRSRKKLNEIMFAEIIGRIDEKLTEIRAEADWAKTGMLIDAPLLFEAGIDSMCDIVLVLVADIDVRIKRVCARDGSDPQEVRARIDSQMSDREKIKRADAVIDNSDGVAELHANIDEFLAEYLPEL